MEDAGPDPADQLTALFEALQGWYDEPVFRGCALLNAAAQHHDDAVRAITARHMDRYRELLTGIARAAGVAEPELVGRQLLMLVEGATVVADHHGSAGVGEQARSAALSLLGASG